MAYFIGLWQGRINDKVMYKLSYGLSVDLRSHTMFIGEITDMEALSDIPSAVQGIKIILLAGMRKICICLSQEGQNEKNIKTNMESLFLFIADDHTGKCAGTAFLPKAG